MKSLALSEPKSEGGASPPTLPAFKESKAMGPPNLMLPPSMPPSMPPLSMPPPSMPPPSMPPPSMPPPSMPPPSMLPPLMPPPKIEKCNLPGPVGPPPMRVKEEPVQIKAIAKSSSDVDGEGNGAVMAVHKIKVSVDPPPLGLLEELESLEETLNESIRENLGARTEKSILRKKPVFEDKEDENNSDDEFYDRTNKPKQKTKQGEAVQVVETAETLLEERDVLAKEMDVILVELQAEEAKSNTKEESNVTSESIDPLDAFLSSLSTNIVKDRAACLSKELSKLQAEADRIFCLLKIADPSGDIAWKWDGKAEGSSQSQKVESIVENWLRVRANKEIARDLASQSKEALNSASEIPAPSTANVSNDFVDPMAETEELPVLEVAGDQLGSEGRRLPDLMTDFMVDVECNGCVKSVRTKLEPLDGVKSVDVSLENQVVRILGSTTIKDLTAASVESGRKARIIGQGLLESLTAPEEAQEQESRSRNSLQQQQQLAGTETRGRKKRKLEPERPPAIADASGCEFVDLASSTASQPRAAGPQDPKEELMQENVDLSEGLDTGHPAVTVSEPQSQGQTPSSLQLGRTYTRDEIHKMLGGGVQQFLPTKDGRVVCGCFRPEWNPLAPNEVLLGPGQGESTAEKAVRQGGRLPIFLRRAVKAWEYVGDYRVTCYVERGEAGREAKARWAEFRANRKGNDLAGVLYMEKA